MAISTASIAKEVSKVPWYGWGGVGVILALLFSAKKGIAAVPPSNVPPDPAGLPKSGAQPTIKAGSTGEAVKLWQTIIGVTVTGNFDAATIAATKAWQTVHGLTPDGIVGKNTWKVAGYYDESPNPNPGNGGGGNVPDIGAGADNPFNLSDGIPQREAQILAFAQQGMLDIAWEPMLFSGNGHSVTVQVTKRALALTDGSNRYTFNMSFRNTQKLADMLGSIMMTTKVSDAVQKDGAAKKITAITQPWSQDGTMAKTSRMSQQNIAIANAVGDFEGLVSNEGKDWVLTRRFWVPPLGTGVDKPEGQTGSIHNAANFGWYPGASKSPGGMSVIQSIGLAHDKSHTDYSQLVRLIKREVQLDGVTTDIAVVLADPALSALLQDEGGIIPDTSHPDLV